MTTYGYGYDEQGNPLSPEVLAKRENEVWSKLIADLKSVFESVHRQTVKSYWVIGKVIASACDTTGGLREGDGSDSGYIHISFKREYGKRNMDDLARDLSAAGFQTSASRLYHALRFFNTYPDEDKLNKLLERKIPWDAIRSVLRRNLPPSERENLLNQYAGGEISLKALKAAVSEIIGTKKSDKSEQEDLGEPPVVDVPADNKVDESTVSTSDDSEPREISPKNVAVALFDKFEGRLEGINELIGDVTEYVKNIPDIEDKKVRVETTAAATKMLRTAMSTMRNLHALIGQIKQIIGADD